MEIRQDKIDITGIDLRKLVKEAYNLSQPQGLGFIHFQPGPLPEEDVNEILSRFEDDERYAVSMDYVRGRAVKLHVWQEGDRLFTDARWYDHSDAQLRLLLMRVTEE